MPSGHNSRLTVLSDSTRFFGKRHGSSLRRPGRNRYTRLEFRLHGLGGNMKCLAVTNQPGLDRTYAWESRRRIQLPGGEKRGAGAPCCMLAECWDWTQHTPQLAQTCSIFPTAHERVGHYLLKCTRNQQQLSIVCRRRKSHQTTGPSRDCTSSKRAAFKRGAGGFPFFPQLPASESLVVTRPSRVTTNSTPTRTYRNNAPENGPHIDGSRGNGDRHHDGRRRRRNIGSPGHGHGRHGRWLQDLGSSATPRLQLGR